jgi:hypothetical protein
MRLLDRLVQPSVVGPREQCRQVADGDVRPAHHQHWHPRAEGAGPGHRRHRGRSRRAVRGCARPGPRGMGQRSTQGARPRS